MSYILDALRKADAEREQGEVPGLHTQTHVSTEPTRPHQLNRKLLWAIAALSSLLILALVWIFSRHDNAPQPAPSQLPAPTPLTTAIQTQPEAVRPPPPVPLAPPAPIYPPLEASTPPAAPPQQVAPSPAGKVAPAAAPVAARAATPTAPPPVDESHRIYKLQDLPDAIRKELPTISIGGAMYSDTPSQRILIISGQVLHEGDQAGPGLKLEEIKLKSAIFQFKNYRYVVNY